MLSGNSLRQTVHTHRTSVHQAAKLVAALLRVARVTAGLVESNGSLPLGLWFTSPAGSLPKTGISSRTLRSVIEYGLHLLLPMGESERVLLPCRGWKDRPVATGCRDNLARHENHVLTLQVSRLGLAVLWTPESHSTHRIYVHFYSTINIVMAIIIITKQQHMWSK